MRYEVFADRVFLMHFGMNFVLLVLTAKLGGYRTGWKRLIKAAALGSLFYVCVLLWPMGSIRAAGTVKTVLQAVGTLATLCSAFGMSVKGLMPKARKRTKAQHPVGAHAGTEGEAVLEAGFLYMASACVTGGVLTLENGPGKGLLQGTSAMKLLIPAALAAIVGIGMTGRLKERQKNPFWEVELKDGEKSCRVTALVDSGNSLFDPVSKRPVCIVQREVLKQLDLLDRPEKFRLIPYHSIGRQHGLLQAAAAEEMYLQKGGQKLKRENVLLACSDQPLSRSGRYRMLLHPALLEETKGANHDIESSDAGKDAV